ncbi:MAG: guanylate kinase [Porphyromonas sp.]|uniref:guanylate kinase n=1 Tax=Porphyromonas sp. TaxID=1924944 RepID=UPI002A91FF20|nr:guanylate kinase [Porphyromonas sp.]MDD7468200.1 guanylate kinase [Bacteroidales bacterium]MDY6102675.1 guanylate kinase [Porphyromonas sp.]
MQGKLIIFSAPSGSGKSTIINKLMSEYGLQGRFSISATSRKPRGSEQDGVEYYFLSEEDFRRRISEGDFLEYEEVYPGCFYGTLRSEVDRTLDRGENVILDIDVQGGLNVKKIYGDRALTLFIQPPSIERLRERLERRGTDAPEVIERRLAKAETELSFAPKYDAVVVNDDLEEACQAAARTIEDFLSTDV